MASVILKEASIDYHMDDGRITRFTYKGKPYLDLVSGFEDSEWLYLCSGIILDYELWKLDYPFIRPFLRLFMARTSGSAAYHTVTGSHFFPPGPHHSI